MIELEAPQEKALLVGAPMKDVRPTLVAEHLAELSRLADTAGAAVAGSVVQRLDAPHPRFYVGEGKAKEIRDAAEQTGSTLVLFDEELSPAQGKNLEDFTGVRVMDRAELILDIFATRARTNEAKMQVELAQLQYMLPRLTRMWAHLSRVRGGIGMRGPGETQLETDRRMIGQRISRLKDELETVAKRRATQRKGRADMLRASLVGYTNAGKSSVLRGISGDEMFVEDRLFATLDAATRVVELADGYEALVTDTVGFIRKLPHHLVASFRATLEEAQQSDLLLHVIDISHPGWEEQKEVVEEVLTDLELQDKPTVLVFNKIDRLTHDEEQAWRQRAEALYPEPAVFVSTVEEGALAPLRELLWERVREMNPQVRITLPASRGGLLAEVYREGEVLEQRMDGATIHLLARLPVPVIGRLRQDPAIRLADG